MKRKMYARAGNGTLRLPVRSLITISAYIKSIQGENYRNTR